MALNSDVPDFGIDGVDGQIVGGHLFVEVHGKKSQARPQCRIESHRRNRLIRGAKSRGPRHLRATRIAGRLPEKVPELLCAAQRRCIVRWFARRCCKNPGGGRWSGEWDTVHPADRPAARIPPTLKGARGPISGRSKTGRAGTSRPDAIRHSTATECRPSLPGGGSSCRHAWGSAGALRSKSFRRSAPPIMAQAAREIVNNLDVVANARRAANGAANPLHSALAGSHGAFGFTPAGGGGQHYVGQLARSWYRRDPGPPRNSRPLKQFQSADFDRLPNRRDFRRARRAW